MRYITFFAALILMLSFIGCADEMPQVDGELEQDDYPPTYQDDVIDTTLYELSSVGSYSRNMLNMPFG